MRAFKGAIEVGAHALETDVHLTSDGVVVLSHVIPGNILTKSVGAGADPV